MRTEETFAPAGRKQGAQLFFTDPVNEEIDHVADITKSSRRQALQLRVRRLPPT